MADYYYRALPGITFCPTENRYVAEVRVAFDWVTEIKQASADYEASCNATQQKLREQYDIDTELVRVDDRNLLQAKFVLRRKDRAC